MEKGNTHWWDVTWNPVGGCEPVSPGSTNWIGARLAGALHQQATAKRTVVPLYEGTVVQIGDRYWYNGNFTVAPSGDPLWTFPLRWPGAKDPLLGKGQRSLIFV